LCSNGAPVVTVSQFSWSHDQMSLAVSRVFLGFGVALIILTLMIFFNSILVFLDGSPSFGIFPESLSKFE
jgi:hypothetical protein